MEIKYNDTFSTSHSSDGVFDFIEKDTTILKGSRNESTSLPKSTEVNSNETLSSGYKPQSVQLDKPESPLVKGTVVEVKPILLSDPDVNTKAAFAKSHTRDFYKGRSFRYAGKWEEGVHYINDEYITDFVVKDGVLLVCKKSNMSSWSNEPTEWVYDGDQIISIISDYWEVVLVGGLRGKTYLPEYDEDSDSLVWRLVDPTDLPEEFQTYLGIKDYIDYSLVPVQEDIIDLQSDADITKRSVRALEGEVVDLGNGLTTLEVITGHISTHVEDLEGNFSDFVQTSEGFFYRVGDLENNVGQLWLTSQQFGIQMENAEGDIARLTIEADQISTRVENAEGDISQINQRADEISTQVENQQGDISRISQRADQIQSEVENQQGDISRITQRADLIESQVSNLEGDVSVISQTADEIQSQVTNLEGDVSTISQRADEITSRVENVEGDVSTVTQRADLIESQVLSLDGDVSTISQRADQIQSQVENVEGDVSTVTQRANLIEAQVQNQAGDISRISQTADQIQSEVSNLEGDVSTVTQKADLIESQVQDVEGDVSTISQRADSIELEVLNQQGDISDIRQTADDINLRVENVEGDIATLDVRADQITSTVTDQQGQISQIRQTSTEIASEVAANKVDADNKYTETNSRITQTAAEINLEVARVEGKVDANARTFTEALGNLQDQIDGAIDTWFYDYAPVHTDAQGVPDSQVPLNVVPYSDWVAAETVEEPEKVRDSHVSDIFYDQRSGYAYRFIGTGNPGSRVYTWVVIQDSAVIKALEDAARAQDTADNKRRVFVATPYAPYDLGDLWVKTTTVGSVAATELYRCIVAKTTVGTENIAADWAVADSYAKEVSKSNIEILSDAIIQQTLTYTYDEYGRLSNTTRSAITTGMNDISLAITGSKLETVGIFIRNADVNDNYINLISDKVRIKGTGNHAPTALSIDWDSTSSSYKISAANLHVEGAFETSAWTDATTGQKALLESYANTAAGNAQTAAETTAAGYLRSALYGNGTTPQTADGGVYGTYNFLTSALSGTTYIQGGLILSTAMVLGSNTGTGGAWEAWAGISGQYDSTAGLGGGPAAWYGGNRLDAFTLSGWSSMTDQQKEAAWTTDRYARSLFRQDGSGYLASGQISWGKNGDVTIHGASLYDGANQITIAQLLELYSWFTKESITIGGVSRTYLRLVCSDSPGGLAGFVSDGFISAGGLSSGGGSGGGVDPLAMWRLLTNDPALASYDNNTKIAVAHIPDIASTYSYLKLAEMWSSLQNNDSQTYGYNRKLHNAHLPTAGTGISYTIDSDGIATGISVTANTYAPYNAAGYLPLTGGTMSNTNLVTNLNADLLDGLDGMRYLHYTRYHPDSGMLVMTDIDSDTMFNFHILGNSYFENIPVDSEVQGYWYRSGNDSIIGTGAINHGHPISQFKVFVYDGVLCLWFAQTSSYQTYQVSCYVNRDHHNHVVATYNEAFPSSATKTVTITPKNNYVGSSAIGSSIKPIYYNGSSFTTCGDFVVASGSISSTSWHEMGYGNGSDYGWWTHGPAMSFGTTSYTMQIQSNFAGGGLKYRNINNDVAGSWYKIWTEENDGSTSGLDADLLDGQHGSYYFSTGGGVQMGGAGTQLILATRDYSAEYNGGIQLREYNFAGTNAPDNKSGAPGISFHWSDRDIRKLWMTGSGVLKWGDYNVWTSADNFARQKSYDSTRDFLNTAYSTTEFATSYGPNEIQDGDKCVLTIPTWSGNSANDYQQTQLVFPLNYADIKIRAVSNGTVVGGPYWVLHSGNYGSYALPRTAGSSYPLSGSLYFNDLSGEKTIITNYRSGGVYGMLHDHYNGNVSLNACGAGLYYGYWNTDSHHFYTNGTEKVTINSTGQIVSSIAAGTAPLAVTSYTRVNNLNADKVDDYDLKDWTTPWSPRDFGSGTLIKTNFNYDGQEGEAFYMEIFGDMYTSGGSLFTQVQGYFYAQTLIAYCVTDLGKFRMSGLIAMNIDGKICFWFPRIGYWQSFGVKCYSSSNGKYWEQRAVSIENSADPGGTRRVNLMTYYYQSAFHGENYAANYITAGSTSLNTSAALYVYGNAVATGAITAGSASDARLKTNVQTMNDEDAKRFIMALRPVTFTWNAKATELFDQYVGDDLGFIAQEVQPLMPKAVTPIFIDYLRIQPEKFVAPIVKVAQLHERELNDHELRIRELEKEVEELREENKRLKANW